MAPATTPGSPLTGLELWGCVSDRSSRLGSTSTKKGRFRAPFFIPHRNERSLLISLSPNNLRTSGIQCRLYAPQLLHNVAQEKNGYVSLCKVGIRLLPEIRSNKVPLTLLPTSCKVLPESGDASWLKTGQLNTRDHTRVDQPRITL